MRRSSVIIGLFILAGVLTLNEEASAFYNPGTGRFLSRDPIVDPAFRQTIPEPLPQGRFLDRNQDAGIEGRLLSRHGRQNRAYPVNLTEEGRHLYQYVRSNPISHVDPLGTVCGITVRMEKIGFARFNSPWDYDINWGHKWIEWGEGKGRDSIGYYSPADGGVRDDDWKYTGATGPDYIWDTDKVDKGDRLFGYANHTPCACATCDDIISCLRAVIPSKPYSIRSYNCRDFVADALNACCLKTGKVIKEPPPIEPIKGRAGPWGPW